MGLAVDAAHCFQGGRRLFVVRFRDCFFEGDKRLLLIEGDDAIDTLVAIQQILEQLTKK